MIERELTTKMYNMDLFLPLQKFWTKIYVFWYQFYCAFGMLLSLFSSIWPREIENASAEGATVKRKNELNALE